MSIRHLTTSQFKQDQILNINKLDLNTSTYTFDYSTTKTISVSTSAGHITAQNVGEIGVDAQSDLITLDFTAVGTGNIVLLQMYGEGDQGRKLRVVTTDLTSTSVKVQFRNDGGSDASGTDYGFMYLIV